MIQIYALCWTVKNFVFLFLLINIFSIFFYCSIESINLNHTLYTLYKSIYIIILCKIKVYIEINTFVA